MGKRILYGRGRYDNHPKVTRGKPDQYHFRDDHVHIRITRENALHSSGGVGATITMGFENVDLTKYDRVGIVWSHEAKTSRRQDRSFFGVHGDLPSINRNNAEGPGYRHHRTLLDASTLNGNTSFTRRTTKLDVSKLSGPKAIGFGAQISTGSTSGGEFVDVKIYEVFLESDDVDCRYRIETTSCTADCDNPNGTYREIPIIEQAAQGRGKPCPEIETKDCMAEGCCYYKTADEENPWGECNRICNTGVQKQRQILDPDKSDVNDPGCAEERTIERECNTHECRWAGEAEGELPPSHFGDESVQASGLQGTHRNVSPSPYDGGDDDFDDTKSDPETETQTPPSAEPDDEEDSNRFWILVGGGAVLVVLFLFIRSRSTSNAR